jgi:hypothetical protein
LSAYCMARYADGPAAPRDRCAPSISASERRDARRPYVQAEGPVTSTDFAPGTRASHRRPGVRSSRGCGPARMGLESPSSGRGSRRCAARSSARRRRSLGRRIRRALRPPPDEKNMHPDEGNSNRMSEGGRGRAPGSGP